MREPWLFFCFALFLILNCYSTTAQHPSGNLTANLSTTWSNTDGSLPSYVSDTDASRIRTILMKGLAGPSFACGFYCNGNCSSYLFAVFIVVPLGSTGGVGDGEVGMFLYNATAARVVWSANRDHMVSEGATLNFTATGNLVLQDFDGSMVWTTNTSDKSVAGLKLTDDGNLVLFDVNNSVVWQSFDYPTDCLVLGQTLFQEHKLIPSVSSTNWTTQKDLFSFQVTNDGWSAYVGSNPPLEYYTDPTYRKDRITGRRHIRFLNGSLSLFSSSISPSDPYSETYIPQASSAQYMKLMSDGHLRVFDWKSPGWIVVADVFGIEECNYPMACGRYGLCSGNQQCSCLVSGSPRIDYFRSTSDQQPYLGCYEITPLSCNATQDQVLIELKNVKYLNILAYMKSVDIETCKQACVNNCSCQAALFQYDSDPLSGDCFLPSELFTMTTADPDSSYFLNLSAFVKVQNVRSPPSGPFVPSGFKSQSTLGVILTSTIGSIVFLLAAIGFLAYIIRKRRRATKMAEEYIGEVLGMPKQFSYKELKPATENINNKLGQGGFGVVYKGTLKDGSKIAVKCIEGLGQVKESFLVEVESIGSIHHVNLVRLRGFCAWRSQRFLVYEFMSNGSLDRWIYHGNRVHSLDWECRKKIILDVAKGLAYLHEECRHKIIHLDIKPQNILLDMDFNAKVSDFGLSKLIDRNQTQVRTTMRGTPGYLAPEWMSLVITEKVDVYSFGIVLLEMLCGRKKFDRSMPEESWHLLSVLKKCWEDGKLVDMVDKYSEDMQTRSLEVVEMIKVASWCLQYDFAKRPSMSMVVKVLEGVMEVESSLDSNFTCPRLQKATTEHENDMTQLLASVLSGPR